MKKKFCLISIVLMLCSALLKAQVYDSFSIKSIRKTGINFKGTNNKDIENNYYAMLYAKMGDSTSAIQQKSKINLGDINSYGEKNYTPALILSISGAFLIGCAFEIPKTDNQLAVNVFVSGIILEISALVSAIKGDHININLYRRNFSPYFLNF